jgi:transposase
LEQALARANVSISRGALGNWVIRSVDLHLLRVYEALKQKLRSQPLVHGDETWVQVLKEDGRDARAKSFMCWGGRPPDGIETCQSESLGSETEGAAHGQDYPYWYRYVKACLSTAWRER